MDCKKGESYRNFARVLLPSRSYQVLPLREQNTGPFSKSERADGAGRKLGDLENSVWLAALMESAAIQTLRPECAMHQLLCCRHCSHELFTWRVFSVNKQNSKTRFYSQRCSLLLNDAENSPETAYWPQMVYKPHHTIQYKVQHYFSNIKTLKKFQWDVCTSEIDD